MCDLAVTELYTMYFCLEALGDVVHWIVDLWCFPLLSENQIYLCGTNQYGLVWFLVNIIYINMNAPQLSSTGACSNCKHTKHRQVCDVSCNTPICSPHCSTNPCNQCHGASYPDSHGSCHSAGTTLICDFQDLGIHCSLDVKVYLYSIKMKGEHSLRYMKKSVNLCRCHSMSRE